MSVIALAVAMSRNAFSSMALEGEGWFSVVGVCFFIVATLGTVDLFFGKRIGKGLQNYGKRLTIDH
jgi:hypothetical protein